MPSTAKIVCALFILLSTWISVPTSYAQQSPTITLFSETFGDRTHPALLLNAGAGNQSIIWAIELSKQTLDQKVQDYVRLWKLLDGSPKHFDEAYFRAQGTLNYTRTPLQQPYIHHGYAMKASFAEQRAAPALIKLPTLIIQGKNDPVSPPDHGRDLAQQIQHSNLQIWDDFAHAISPQHFDRLVNTIDHFIQTQTVARKSSAESRSMH